MKEKLIKEGWDCSLTHAVCPDSMNDINVFWTKHVDGRRFVYLPEDNFRYVYTYPKDDEESIKFNAWKIVEMVETIDDLNAFVEKHTR